MSKDKLVSEILKILKDFETECCVECPEAWSDFDKGFSEAIDKIIRLRGYRDYPESDYDIV